MQAGIIWAFLIGFVIGGVIFLFVGKRQGELRTFDKAATHIKNAAHGKAEDASRYIQNFAAEVKAGANRLKNL